MLRPRSECVSLVSICAGDFRCSALLGASLEGRQCRDAGSGAAPLLLYPSRIGSTSICCKRHYFSVLYHSGPDSKANSAETLGWKQQLCCCTIANRLAQLRASAPAGAIRCS